MSGLGQALPFGESLAISISSPQYLRFLPCLWVDRHNSALCHERSLFAELNRSGLQVCDERLVPVPSLDAMARSSSSGIVLRG
jgi:hypothetical protein